MRIPLLCLTTALLLAGCNRQKPVTVTLDDPAPSAVDAEASSQSSPGSGGITAIDAAVGEGGGMPADSFAPSAYDLASRSARPTPRRVAPPRAEEPAPGDPENLLPQDDSVTSGD